VEILFFFKGKDWNEKRGPQGNAQLLIDLKGDFYTGFNSSQFGKFSRKIKLLLLLSILQAIFS
jgi:hypothetical protein